MASIELSETTAAALSAQAAAQSLTVEANFASVLLSAPAVSSPRLSRAELDGLLDEEAASGPSPAGAFSRAKIYSDHD